MLLVVLQCRYAFSQDASSKLETLPSTARIVPGDYVVMLDATVNIDDFIATLSDDDSDDQSLQMNIMYVYDHTKTFTGLALSNVSNIGLQALLESEQVATITPVSLLNRVHCH